MNNIHEQIIDFLAPAIGPGLATSALSIQCKKIGILVDELSESNIDLFVEGFERMLTTIAGEQIASSIAEKIRSMK